MAETYQTFSHDSYTVGWICALPETELAVSGAMLDKRHAVSPLNDAGDTTTYLLGRIGPHNVVMACCPDQETGKVSAALVAKDMLRTFKAVRFCLMVGIGGGVPSFGINSMEQDSDHVLEYWDSQEQGDIRLGDVVIGLQTKSTPAVVQFDFGKALHGGEWEVSGMLNDPPDIVRSTISQLKGEHIRKGAHTLSKHLSAMLEENPGLARNFKYQGVENDHVFKPHFKHPENTKTCTACLGLGNENVVRRQRRKDPLVPVLHYGTIGSADQVMKDPVKRDALHKKHKIVCFEMEAAGLMKRFPCLIIRGICDYSDSHKNKIWQPYAAATAAAYAKELLLCMSGPDVSRMKLIETAAEKRLLGPLQINPDCLTAFRTTEYEFQKNANPPRQPGTCLRVLNNDKFLNWRDLSTSCLLWVTADPGCGKSVLSKSLIDENLLCADPGDLAICYFFFKDVSDEQRSAENALAALLHQLFRSRQTAGLIKYALPSWLANKNEISRNFEEMWSIIEIIAMDPISSKGVFLLDGLDECRSSQQGRFIQMLKGLERKTSGRPALKILVTSRPYWDIEFEFQDLIADIPNIELSGYKESKAISSEIDQVIRTKVSLLPRKIVTEAVRGLLLQKLLAVKNRTYLWVHLILDIITRKSRVAPSTIEALLDNLPDTLDKAYEVMLNKSDDPMTATQLLQIIVAATRPLTLKEAGVALYITAGMSSMQDLKPELQEDQQFEATIRALCGLFVSVVDNRVVLIHQTAHKYLVKPKQPEQRAPGKWKHSLDLIDCNLFLAKRCLHFLSLEEFGNSTFSLKLHLFALEDHGEARFDSQKRTRILQAYINGEYLTTYAAMNWAVHLKVGRESADSNLSGLAANMYTKSSLFWTWVTTNYGMEGLYVLGFDVSRVF